MPLPAAGSPSDSVAASTPGHRAQLRQQLLEEPDARRRNRDSCRAADRRARSGRCSIANGICTVFSCTTLLIIRPAAISRPHDSASSATTSAAAEPAEPGARRRPAVVLQHGAGADARRVHRGKRAGEQAREHDQPEHEQHHAVVELERDPERRRVDRQRLREPAHAEDAEQDADARRRATASTSTSVRCWRTTRAASGAERHAHGHLAPPQRARARPAGSTR